MLSTRWADYVESVKGMQGSLTPDSFVESIPLFLVIIAIQFAMSAFFLRNTLRDILRHKRDQETVVTTEEMTRIGVVIPTVGKSMFLKDTLTCLAAQTLAPVEVIVVDQSTGVQVAETVGAAPIPVTRIPSEGGTSRGKNQGLAKLPDVDIVVFFDDDITCPPDFFQRLTEVFKETGAEAVSGVMVTDGRHRVAFTPDRRNLDRRTVWTHTIEPTTFYRRTLLDKIGAFDPTLGVGAPTKWQSGEGTELLLRALDHGATIAYEPSLVVDEHQAPSTGGDYLAKVRKYGRGTGRVYRLRYSWPHWVFVVVKPTAAAVAHLLRRDRAGAAQKLQAALGRVEGLLG